LGASETLALDRGGELSAAARLLSSRLRCREGSRAVGFRVHGSRLAEQTLAAALRGEREGVGGKRWEMAARVEPVEGTAHIEMMLAVVRLGY